MSWVASRRGQRVVNRGLRGLMIVRGKSSRSRSQARCGGERMYSSATISTVRTQFVCGVVEKVSGQKQCEPAASGRGGRGQRAVFKERNGTGVEVSLFIFGERSASRRAQLGARASYRKG
jgi:hypothetical protein